MMTKRRGKSRIGLFLGIAAGAVGVWFLLFRKSEDTVAAIPATSLLATAAVKRGR